MYINGLIDPSVGGYLPRHIKVVAAFEVNTLKIGKDVAEAIYCDPITTPHFVALREVPEDRDDCPSGPGPGWRRAAHA